MRILKQITKHEQSTNTQIQQTKSKSQAQLIANFQPTTQPSKPTKPKLHLKRQTNQNHKQPKPKQQRKKQTKAIPLTNKPTKRPDVITPKFKPN